MKTFLKIILPLAVIAVGLVIRQGLLATAPELGEQEIEAYVPRVNVIEAIEADYQIEVPAFGVVQTQGNVALLSKVQGTLLSVNGKLRRGESFSKGEMLATIDDSDFAQNLAIAEAAVKQATAKLQLENAAAELSVKDWQRISDVPPSDITAHKPQIALAEASLETANAQVILAKLNLERCALHAPFDGRALRLNAETGQWLNPGASIANLIPAEGIEINIPLNLQQLDLLQLPTSGKCQALEVSVTIPNMPEAVRARLVRVSDQLEQGTRMNQAVAVLPVGINVAPQTYLELSVQGPTVSGTFKLPAIAVNNNRAQIVNENSTLHEVELSIIQQLQDGFIVRGLKSQQKINITPLSVFVPGMDVEVVNK